MKAKVSIILVCLIWMASSMYATEGALRGRFAISATDTVAFSRGNLQYQPSTSTWRFAENQWDFVGTANGRIRHYQYSPEGWVWTYKGWLDLFGWGTGNNPTASTSTNSNYGSFTDWGRNAISNGGKKANLWRTLTKDEWDYLFRGRENAASLYANGTVSGVNGSILLPDNWVIPADLHFKPSNSTDSTAAPNNYTADEWMFMEMAGAVFLPITYERSMDWQSEYCTAVYQENTARYWTSTPNGTNGAYYYIPLAPNVYQDNRYVGKAVRLVQNHEGGDLFPVVPNTHSAIFQWTSVPNAETYTLHVYSDSTRTEEAFYITFDRNGVVTGLHFIPHAPARTKAEDTEYTDRLFFYTLNGLQANTDYWYAISGEDANGQTISTVSGSFHTAAVEVATDKVTVDPAQTSAVMTWPTDSAAGSYRIDIYKSGAVFCHLTLGPTGQLLGITFNAPQRHEQTTDGDSGNSTQLPATLSFNITGLEAATRYNYVLSALDENDTPVHVYTGAFATIGYPGELEEGGLEIIPTPPIIPSNPEASVPTDLENTEDAKGQHGKMFLNGQLFILHGNQLYTITGQRLF